MLQNEILEPADEQPKKSKLRKYGPALFWGTMIALPAMNMTAAIFNYRTVKLSVELETLKAAATTLAE
jgi:hypothetical protein